MTFLQQSPRSVKTLQVVAAKEFPALETNNFELRPPNTGLRDTPQQRDNVAVQLATRFQYQSRALQVERN